MSNSGGKITAPVSIEDVRTVLGVSSYDLGTLCKNSNGKINKWSKYKPVRQPFVVAPNSNWYKANDGFCGLTSKAHGTIYLLRVEIVSHLDCLTLKAMTTTLDLL